MVKIPSLDELKKMGSGLIDQAKSVKFGEMVDKVKSGIESVSGKKAPTEVGDEALKTVFTSIYGSLNELTQAQTAQINAVKKLETQLEQLAKIVETYKPATTEAVNEVKSDDARKE
jgi:hypothetical protein